MHASAIFVWALLIFYFAVWTVPYWRIFPRLGYARELALIMPVPFLNICTLFWIAFNPRERA